MALKKWVMLSVDEQNVLKISQKNGVSVFLAFILSARGFKIQDDLSLFLEEKETLPDSFEFKDMKKAISRIKKAIEIGEMICVFGDYDADGITATALLYSFLKQKNANVEYYVPQRENEGYGMSCSVIKRISQRGVKLIITVDNGICAVEEITFAASLGVEVIVTDHHRPHKILPNAFAIVNPYQTDCESQFKDFCGAGLALLLVMAFGENSKERNDLLINYIDFAAIGTIGDLVDIKSSNRFIVKLGLKYIENSKKPGISALLRSSNLSNKKINSQDIAFLVVPRINACGRLTSPEIALELLLSDDSQKALKLAKELDKQNSLRKIIESDITKQASEQINLDFLCKFDPVIVVVCEGWHIGVIGIVASRLSLQYGKPCIVISTDGSFARGSGRSIEGFSLVDAVKNCSDILNRFGGHPMAVGFDIETSKIDEFRQRMNYFARELRESTFSRIEIDCELKPEDINISLIEELKILEPFGHKNPVPVFCMYDLTIINICAVGGSKHLKISFTKNENIVNAMQFSVMPQEFGYQIGDTVDIAFTIFASKFRGQNTLCISIKDIRPCNTDIDLIMKEQKIYEGISHDIYKNLAIREDYSKFAPSRDEFIYVYKRFQKINIRGKTIENIFREFDGINFIKFMFILDVFAELDIIKIKAAGNAVSIEILNPKAKANLTDSKILKKLLSLNNSQKKKTIV
ncbi:MAG: single-stranded-DNA-specific exonuclease RecJ [Oscillospiraceae bacterium]|nr:single-stranded-DNA-specific exonuclease RecJ [Oscillospiraceae bacterium]